MPHTHTQADARAHTPNTHTPKVDYFSKCQLGCHFATTYTVFLLLLFLLFIGFSLYSSSVCCCSSRARPPPCHQRCHFVKEKKKLRVGTHINPTANTNERTNFTFVFFFLFFSISVFSCSFVGSFALTQHVMRCMRFDGKCCVSRSDIDRGVVLHGAWRTLA